MERQQPGQRRLKLQPSYSLFLAPFELPPPPPLPSMATAPLGTAPAPIARLKQWQNLAPDPGKPPPQPPRAVKRQQPSASPQRVTHVPGFPPAPGKATPRTSSQTPARAQSGPAAAGTRPVARGTEVALTPTPGPWLLQGGMQQAPWPPVSMWQGMKLATPWG